MTDSQRPLKVFLCHASADKPQVRELYRYLRKRGIRPWLDEIDLMGGQEWEEEIQKALESCDVVIICLTRHSVSQEGYNQREMRFALDKALNMPPGRIFLIPVRLEECDVPQGLRRYQWVDLFSDRGHERLMRSLRARAEATDASVLETTKQKKSLHQERILEAVIENPIIVGKPASLSVLIRRLGSKSILSVVYSVDEDAVLAADKVKAKQLEIEFPLENGRVLSAAISLKLTAHEFSPATQQKIIDIPPDGDSEVCTFEITPKKAGTLLLSLEVLKDGVSLAARTLRTTARENEKQDSSLMVLVSIPIVVFVQASTSIADSIPNLRLEKEKKARELIETGNVAQGDPPVVELDAREKIELNKKDSSKPVRRRRIDSPTAMIIVALIGLVGTVITALVAPIMVEWIQRPPDPTTPPLTFTSTHTLSTNTPVIPTRTLALPSPAPFVTVQDINILENGIIIASVRSDETTNVSVGSNVTVRANFSTNIALEDLHFRWEFCRQPENNKEGQGVSEILYKAPGTRGPDCIRLIIDKGGIRLTDHTVFLNVR
jgi:hypothetical protein